MRDMVEFAVPTAKPCVQMRRRKWTAVGDGQMRNFIFAAEPQPEDPEALLQSIRNRITDHLTQLHNYTCHVVIDRVMQTISTGRFDQRDTAQLDVAFVDNKELFSRPGAARFEEQSINQLVPLGMIGNDILGSHNESVFSGGAAKFSFAGRCKKDGHKAVRYNFNVAQADSQLLVKLVNSGDAVVGYHGSIWADAETLDMVRLEWKTDHIPSSVGLSSVGKTMRYEKVHLGHSDFWLPLRSELSSTDNSGHYRLNVVRLEKCLEYTGESVVTFGKAVEPPKN